MSISQPFNIIASATGTGSSGTVSFGSIPQTYKSLIFMGQTHTDYASGNVQCYVRLNSDSGAYYSQKSIIYENGSGTGRNVNASNQWQLEPIPSSDASYYAGFLGWFELVIPNYTQSSNWQMMQFAGGAMKDSTSSGIETQGGGSYYPAANAAVTTVEFILAAGNWTTDSKITMYGLG